MKPPYVIGEKFHPYPRPDRVKFNFDPVLVGICGSMGMMPPYHTESAQANPRISKVVAVYGTEKNATLMAELYGIPQAFFRDRGDESEVFDDFLRTHQLTVIAGPNNVHVPQAEAAINVPYVDSAGHHGRYLYIEKPPANSLEGAVRLAELEKEYPGRIAVVAHNRLWDMLLEMRYMIAQGEIGNITNAEVQYQQDWQGGKSSPGWRNVKGVVGETGDERTGIVGKLSDIAYHALDTITFTTGTDVIAIGGANVFNIEPRKIISAGEAFGAAQGEELVAVGGDSPYHGDDVMYAALLLSGADSSREIPARLTVSQTDVGRKNHLSLTVYGPRGSLSFSTDDPLNLYLSHGSPETTRINYASPALGYTKTLPEWLQEGLDIRPSAPFGYHTPPDHMTGWTQVHKRQFQSFALYAQLASRGHLSVSEREQLFTVPTAREAEKVMKAMKTIYEAACQRQRLPVDYARS